MNWIGNEKKTYFLKSTLHVICRHSADKIYIKIIFIQHTWCFCVREKWVLITCTWNTFACFMRRIGIRKCFWNQKVRLESESALGVNIQQDRVSVFNHPFYDHLTLNTHVTIIAFVIYNISIIKYTQKKRRNVFCR